ncbi:branched-chain amino acid ABC transporter permease [Nakamurella lactea]|uniref:branched-chain amino acid ABC transporter permease n=1 Tax=Nakamurella lactea TaxID=459515 RepID=UPI0004136086|nr:branched-chain amino acid ABC transporter permease [Nakamurella lactea]
MTESTKKPPIQSEPAVPAGRGGPAALVLLLRRHRWSAEVVVTLAAAALLVAYGSGPSFRQDYVVLICTYGLLALGMYVPYIMSGSLSLAYNAYLGIGAYACALISTKAGWSSLWGVPIGMVLSAAIAVLLGLATRKLTGFYLAGVTLLFGVAFQVFLLDRVSITGGAMGMTVARPELFGQSIKRYQIMVVGVVLVWVVGILLARLRQSPYGVVVRLRKDVPQVVEASGISAGNTGIVSLAIGAAIGSLGGSLFGMMGGVAQPESFGLHIIFLAIFMPLLGGQRSPWGAVLGALIVVVFTFELDLVEDTGTLIFAIAILLVLRLAPEGLLGLVGKGWQRFCRRLGVSGHDDRGVR